MHVEPCSPRQGAKHLWRLWSGERSLALGDSPGPRLELRSSHASQAGAFCLVSAIQRRLAAAAAHAILRTVLGLKRGHRPGIETWAS